METTLSTPIEELPAYLSSISMVCDDVQQIVNDLIHAERKSPKKYHLARDLFLGVLEGDFSFADAVAQARLFGDGTVRKCTLEVLDASRSFLTNGSRSDVTPLDRLWLPLPNGKELLVSPVWLCHSNPHRLLVLHFWLKPLSDWQIKAALAILVEAMKRDNHECLTLDIDFISVARPEHSARRQFQLYDWYKLRPLDEGELDDFLQRLCAGWQKYRSRALREVKLRGDRHPIIPGIRTERSRLRPRQSK